MRRTVWEIKSAWKLFAKEKFSHLFLIWEREIAKDEFKKAFEILDKWYDFHTSILDCKKARDLYSAKKYLADYYFKKFIKK